MCFNPEPARARVLEGEGLWIASQCLGLRERIEGLDLLWEPACVGVRISRIEPDAKFARLKEPMEDKTQVIAQLAETSLDGFGRTLDGMAHGIEAIPLDERSVVAGVDAVALLGEMRIGR